MADTNNVRITTPGGTITYVDNTATGGTDISTDTSSSSTTNTTVNSTQTTIIKNLGTGQQISAGIVSTNTYGLKSLVAGNNITLTSDDDTITINSTSKANIIAGDNIELETNEDGSITISAESSFSSSDIKSGSDINVVENSDGSVTINSTAPTGVTELSKLSDVDLTTTAPASGDLLQYNGSKWVPYTNVEYPVGSLMCLKLTGTMGMASNGSALVLKSITNLPSGWSATYSDVQVTITSNIPSGTAFPITMVTSVTSQQQVGSTAKNATLTAFNAIGASFDYNDATGVLTLYRINQDTVYSSGSETNIDLYISFYILKEQTSIWS